MTDKRLLEIAREHRLTCIDGHCEWCTNMCAALRAAYRKGMERAAEIADDWTENEEVSEAIRAEAIREEGKDQNGGL